MNPCLQEISVVVTVQIATGPTKLKKPAQPCGLKHTQEELKFKELVTMVYGEHAGHYAEGEWTEGATELLQSQGWVSKWQEMAKLTEKGMGSITMDGSWVGQSHYLHNPCVLICPFEGDKCKHAKHRLNRVGGISQLYLHWQICHKESPAARVLEKRWRTVMKARTISVNKLNALPGHALEVSGTWMQAQGGLEKGYEQLRSPSAHTSDGDVWRCAPCKP